MMRRYVNLTPQQMAWCSGPEIAMGLQLGLITTRDGIEHKALIHSEREVDYVEGRLDVPFSAEDIIKITILDPKGSSIDMKAYYEKMKRE